MLSLIFGLLLQFYLQNQLTAYKQQILRKDKLTAELMVNLTEKARTEKSGTVRFDKGTVTYQMSDVSSNQIEFEVYLTNGKRIHFISAVRTNPPTSKAAE